MTDIKSKVQGMDPNISAKDVGALVEETGNIYQTLTIISKRAKQLNTDLKYELQQKLDEFAITTDNIEEVYENKEQIEISKFYERIPNPVVIATNEFQSGELEYRFKKEKPKNDY